MFKSIRWSLQLWHAGLLSVVLVGFGTALYYGISKARYAEIDDNLRQSLQVLAAGARQGPRSGGDGRFGGPRRGGPDGHGGPDGRGGPGRPAPTTSVLDRSPGTTTSPFDRAQDHGHDRPPMPPFDVSEEWLRQYGNARPPYYYVLWDSEGALIEKSDAAIDVPDPDPNFGAASFTPRSPSPAVIRQRDSLREVYIHGPFDTRLLVGRPITYEENELRRLVWLLVGAGAAVLIVGLTGGWFISLRAVRPIHAITSVAREISASNLSRRIDTVETQSELGSLATVLNDTFARLESAFQQQVRFTADASHELRTPLAVIHTHTQLALSRPRTVEEYQKAFATCLRASEKMKGLVDSLLLLARADAGRLSLDKAHFDLREVIEECVEMLKALAEKKSVVISINLQSVEIDADPLRLAQLVTNLLTNAIRYNLAGGAVNISLVAENGLAVLTVADTGVGIEQENQRHLFERFYRVDSARSREDGGSGLGLAICRTIVDAHQGQIECVSEIGKGTTFTVRLPLQLPPTVL